MALFELQSERIVAVDQTRFGAEGVRERDDLQRLLRTNVDVVSPGTLIIKEEFGDWEDSRRRIDLLGLDKQANLVVIELKRSEDGGHMELQALRYAAMVANMTFEQAVTARAEFQRRNNTPGEAQDAILTFLGWEEPNEDHFVQNVRIVLVAADFSRELTTSVLWLNDYDLDIRCVRLRPYTLDGRVVLDVQQIIPIPEAHEYQVQVREKIQKERSERGLAADFTRYDVMVGGATHENQWKRNAILLVVKGLVEGGVHPDRIIAALKRSDARLWRSVDGHVGSAEFRAGASLAADGDGLAFDESRWACDDNELIRFEDRTYAFSSQWSGKRWHEAMEQLKEAFPEFRISFAPTTGVK